MSNLPIRVLVAEDETIIRLDLVTLIERNGLVVCAEARDGEEAVSLARSEQPDAVLLDVKMPRLDGVEAARRIYAERPTPIVMLTAYSDRRLVEKAIAAGAFAYLVKPFRETDVVPAIRAAVVRHAELLDARRELGNAPKPLSFDVVLPSRVGQGWPVRVRRSADGSLQVSAVPPA